MNKRTMLSGSLLSAQLPTVNHASCAQNALDKILNGLEAAKGLATRT
jgi:hypothetical protein